MPEARNALRAAVTRDADTPVTAAVRAGADAATAQGGGVAAVLFYGSGIDAAEPGDTLLDYYILVDSFTAWYGRRGLKAALGAMLPPNVHYVRTTAGGREIHAKAAVMRLDQFRRAAAGRGPTPQIWARFAQPCRLVYARDDTARDHTLTALVDAVETFHRAVLPLIDRAATPATVWKRGLDETYARELRSEPDARIDALLAARREHLVERTRLAAAATGLGDLAANGTRVRVTVARGQQRMARVAARLARPLGKAVAFLRLLKATLTFTDGVSYALWKVERHTGVRVEASRFQRRHPLLAAWPLMWKVYRRGGFR